MNGLPAGYARGPEGAMIRPLEPRDAILRPAYTCAVCGASVIRDEVVAAGWWYNTSIVVEPADSYYCAACAALVRE